MLRDTVTCQENYKRFIERVVGSGEVWTLSDESGALSCASNENEEVGVILFFSDSAYARRVQTPSFPEHSPDKFDLFDLLFRWLPGMSNDGVLAGPNWTGDLVGLEIDPFELREELEKHLTPEQHAEFAKRYRESTGRQAGEA